MRLSEETVRTSVRLSDRELVDLRTIALQRGLSERGVLQLAARRGLATALARVNAEARVAVDGALACVNEEAERAVEEALACLDDPVLPQEQPEIKPRPVGELLSERRRRWWR